MFFRKKKKFANVIDGDRKLLDNIKVSLAVVISQLGDDVDNKLIAIRDNLKYIQASGDANLSSFDKKMVDKLDDLKIAISKKEINAINKYINDFVTLYIYRTGNGV